MTPRPKTGAIVAVQWADAARMAGAWQDVEEAREFRPLIAHSVGFVVKSTKTRLVLAMSVHESQLGGAFVIPAACVRSVDVLQEP